VILEQYPTPAELAANIVHRAALEGDLTGTVVDLGAGTGLLSIAAAFHAPDRVVGLEIDPAAIRIAQGNQAAGEPPVPIHWVNGDATSVPLCPPTQVTVLTNPPFGAQRASKGDRGFLVTASRIATVSYSIHNAGSRDFVEAVAREYNGSVTHAFAAEIDLERKFPFHTSEDRAIDVEVYRIEWDQR
jgi:putative methylase